MDKLIKHYLDRETFGERRKDLPNENIFQINYTQRHMDILTFKLYQIFGNFCVCVYHKRDLIHEYKLYRNAIFRYLHIRLF